MLFVVRFVKLSLPAMISAALFGCAPDYSPNTYSSEAVQQANKVEAGVVVGFREVAIRANGSVGAVTGGAAGGILGAQADAGGIPTAIGALGGTVVGSIVGTTIEHATGDTTGWEYIVREPNNDLISVTQREKKPIAIGQKVLVITGKQARIVPDYSMALTPPPDPVPSKDGSEKKETPRATSSPVSITSQPSATTPSETAAPVAISAPAILTPATPLGASPSPLPASPDPAAPSNASEPESAAPQPAPTLSPPPAATGSDGDATAPKTPPS